MKKKKENVRSRRRRRSIGHGRLDVAPLIVQPPRELSADVVEIIHEKGKEEKKKIKISTGPSPKE